MSVVTMVNTNHDFILLMGMMMNPSVGVNPGLHKHS